MKKKDTCASCGLPKRLKDDLTWTVDGNIFTRFRPKREVMFFDHRELGTIMDQAVKQGGDELLVRLKENRRRYIRNRTLQQMEGAGAGLISGRMYRKRAVSTVLEGASLYGWGRVTVNEMDPPDSLQLEVSHPYHPELLAADLAGFWEGFFEIRTEYQLERKEHMAWSLELKGVEEKKYRQPERKPIPENKAGKKDKSLERCGRCGLPTALGHLQWDAGKGTIFDPGSGRYLAVLEVAGLQALVREMRNHLTGDYAATVRSAFQEELGREGRRPSVKELCRDVLDPWPVLGWGKAADLRLRPFLAEVVVTCPALPSFVEQKIAACWQLAEKEAASSAGAKLGDCDFRVSVGPQLAEYSINVETLKGRFPQLIHYPLSFLPF